MLSSPIYHTKGGLDIDLSQLAEVGLAFFMLNEGNFNSYFKQDDPMWWPGFTYRYARSTDPVTYKRPPRKGPDRNEDLTLVDPSAVLDTVGEEWFGIHGVVNTPASATGGIQLPPRNGITARVLVVHPRTDTPAVLRHIEAERLQLINAWKKWKAIEPEIYAIIRKHLS